MFQKKFLCVFYLLIIECSNVQCKDAICIINGKESLHVVDDKFLSFSVDPETLLKGLNTSSQSVLLAEHMSPAFLQISGSSTEHLQFSSNEIDSQNNYIRNNNSLLITPQIWEAFIYWLKNINLTPIFALNDKGRINGTWNPKSIIPFLDISEERDFYLYWQLGYDCGYKSLDQYKADLLTLKHIVSAYPSSKIVGSNLRSCLINKNSETLSNVLDDLDGVVDAVLWERKSSFRDISINPSYIPVWLIIPKENKSVTFDSGLVWAKQIGEAAKDGFKVIFKQISFEEMYRDTPIFWISLIYKTLIGSTVLSMKTDYLSNSNTQIYAYCAKTQIQNSNKGSLAIMVVNSNNYAVTPSLRIASSHPKTIEIQSYIISSNSIDNRDVFLNGEKLTLDILEEHRFLFIPKIRKVRTHNMLSFNTPKKSIGFFVFPEASIPVCISKENDAYSLLEKFDDVPETNETPKTIRDTSRPINFIRDVYDFFKPPETERYNELPNKVLEIHQNIQDKFRNLKEKIDANKPKDIVGNQLNLEEFRKYLVNQKSKLPERKGFKDRTTKVEIVFTEKPKRFRNFLNNTKIIELELTDVEIRKILKERAKQKTAETGIQVTSEELDTKMVEAANNIIKNKRNAITTVRDKNRRFHNMIGLKKRQNQFRLRNKLRNRRIVKRNINFDLLRNNKNIFQSNLDNRKPVQDLFRKIVDESTELHRYAKSMDRERDRFLQGTLPSDSQRNWKKMNNRDHTLHLSTVLEPMDAETKDDLNSGERYLDERIQFLNGPNQPESVPEIGIKNHNDFYDNNFEHLKQNSNNGILLPETPLLLRNNENNNFPIWRNLNLFSRRYKRDISELVEKFKERRNSRIIKTDKDPIHKRINQKPKLLTHKDIGGDDIFENKRLINKARRQSQNKTFKEKMQDLKDKRKNNQLNKGINPRRKRTYQTFLSKFKNPVPDDTELLFMKETHDSPFKQKLKPNRRHKRSADEKIHSDENMIEHGNEIYKNIQFFKDETFNTVMPTLNLSIESSSINTPYVESTVTINSNLNNTTVSTQHSIDYCTSGFTKNSTQAYKN